MKPISILMYLTLSLAAAAPAAQSANDLFQQALTKERTEGNLPEAIKLYQQIVRLDPERGLLVLSAMARPNKRARRASRARGPVRYRPHRQG